VQESRRQEYKRALQKPGVQEGRRQEEKRALHEAGVQEAGGRSPGAQDCTPCRVFSGLGLEGRQSDAEPSQFFLGVQEFTQDWGSKVLQALAKHRTAACASLVHTCRYDLVSS
jgi:hypothetical protein